METIKIYDSSNHLVLCNDQEKKAYIVNKGGTSGLKITKYDTIKQLAQDHNVFALYDNNDVVHTYPIDQEEAMIRFKGFMNKYYEEIKDLLEKIQTTKEFIEKYKKE